MVRRLLSGPGALVLLLCWAGAHAEELMAPTGAETLALVTSDQFDVLDQRFSTVQQAYEEGRITDEELVVPFRAFYATDASLESHYEAWISHSPKSYVAHLARGIYYKFVGLESRGHEFFAKTSPEQIQGMEAAFEKGRAEFAVSLDLSPRPQLTYLHSMDLAAADGTAEEKRSLLDHSIAIDPQVFMTRLKYMSYLLPRWGGSVEEMKDFLRDCRKAGLSREHLKTLESLIAEEQGVAAEQEGNPKRAARAYKKAAKLDAKRGCRPCGPINEAAEALMRAKSYKAAIPLYSQVLASDPKFAIALVGRGYCEWRLVQWPAAIKDLTAAADLGNAWAQYLVGAFYLTGDHFAPDPDKGLALLQKSSDQGYQDAKNLLKQLHDGPPDATKPRDLQL